jgi:type II secretory pathway component GspD/PulD (secretin)
LLTSKARLVQSARIATMNNYPASITSNTQEPYVDFSGGGAVVNGGIVNPSATVRVVNVPTSLTITPRINGDDSVTALLTPTISSSRSVEIPTPIGKQFFPVVSSSQLSTFLNVKDGETMVIGGFVNRKEELSRSKIPLLSDLPILGPLLFTSTSRNTNDTETLIFVTPHVIKDESAEVTSGPL